jgi:hypothetical protein
MANSQQRPIKTWLWYTKRNAEKRGLLWGISDRAAMRMFTLPCHWCGHVPEGRAFNGIDRVNRAVLPQAQLRPLLLAVQSR